MDKYIFGITGGSGAGKSTVSDMFRSVGVYVSDADKTAREIVKKGSPCLEELKKVFGTDIVDKQGELKRRKLGEIVFSDAEKLKMLNCVTHKYITEYTKREIEDCGKKICAIDGAVIIGSPVMKLCRCMVSVIADEEIRVKRISERDNISCESARNRIASQMTNDEYIRNSDYVIFNDGDIEGLKKQIEQIYSEIKNRAQAQGTKTKA
jgi:dephospho-CoA kinase